MGLIRELDVGTKNLETDLKNNKVPMSEDDKFLDVMTVSSLEARMYWLCGYPFSTACARVVRGGGRGCFKGCLIVYVCGGARPKTNNTWGV